MKPIEFPEANECYAKNQPPYNPLPVFKKPNDPQGLVVTKHVFSPEEFQRVFETGAVYLSMLTFNEPLQPVLLTVDYPENMDPIKYESQAFGAIVCQVKALRRDAISKGKTIKEDIQLNHAGQLAWLAGFLCYLDLMPDKDKTDEELRKACPPNWNIGKFLKYCKLPLRDRLIMAASFIVADVDRMDEIERKEILDVR